MVKIFWGKRQVVVFLIQKILRISGIPPTETSFSYPEAPFSSRGFIPVGISLPFRHLRWTGTLGQCNEGDASQAIHFVAKKPVFTGFFMVETCGVEPQTSYMRSKRSTS